LASLPDPDEPDDELDEDPDDEDPDDDPDDEEPDDEPDEPESDDVAAFSLVLDEPLEDDEEDRLDDRLSVL
jgi:autoinducer 2-binding periplasmic protein LuxP